MISRSPCACRCGGGLHDHLVTRPVDVTQQPPQSPSGAAHWSMGGVPGGGHHHHGGLHFNMAGMQGGLDRSDIGTVRALCVPVWLAISANQPQQDADAAAGVIGWVLIRHLQSQEIILGECLFV